MDPSAVRAYYAAKSHHERDRLLSAEGLLERVLTTRLLEPHLGEPGRALDLGGGTGPYSVWLAELGWDVTLADLSPELLAIAESSLPAGTVREVVEIDARDLSRWGDATFDAVLSLGPMYHLTTPRRPRAAPPRARARHPPRRARRRRADAAVRAPCAGSCRCADERWQLADPAFLDRLLDDGVLENARPRPVHARVRRRAGGRRAVLRVARVLHRVAGLDARVPHGRRGRVRGAARRAPRRVRRLLDRLVATASDPGVLATAGHLLYVGRRQPPTSPDS